MPEIVSIALAICDKASFYFILPELVPIAIGFRLPGLFAGNGVP
jgi:hypothetical protein